VRLRFDQIWCLGTGVGQHESVEKSNCSRLPKPLVSGRIDGVIIYALFDNQLSSTFFQCGNFHYSFYDRRGRWQKALTGTTPIVLHGDEVEIVCCFGRSTHPSPAPVEMHLVFLTERCFPSASVPLPFPHCKLTINWPLGGTLALPSVLVASSLLHSPP
jgi:hypothetical protein